MIARKRLKALVLNDEVPFEKLITTMMEAANWDCEVVACPEKALARLKAKQFDLVMTDYRLPDEPRANGLNFISCLRRDGITIPAILMSDDAEVLRTVPKDQLAIPGVLLKPFTASELRVVLDAVYVS